MCSFLCFSILVFLVLDLELVTIDKYLVPTRRLRNVIPYVAGGESELLSEMDQLLRDPARYESANINAE